MVRHCFLCSKFHFSFRNKAVITELNQPNNLYCDFIRFLPISFYFNNLLLSVELFISSQRLEEVLCQTFLKPIGRISHNKYEE